MSFLNWTKLAAALLSALVLTACDIDNFKGESNGFANQRGQQFYETRCSNCHGIDGAGGSSIGIDPTRPLYQEQTLEKFIESSMQSGGRCVDECSVEVAKYIRSWSTNGGGSDNNGGSGGNDSGNVSDDPDALTGDATRGATLYSEQQCSLCHGTSGGGITPLDATKSEYSHTTSPAEKFSLAKYIHQYMGPNSAPKCSGQCAADVAAFLRTWSDGGGGTGPGDGGTGPGDGGTGPGDGGTGPGDGGDPGDGTAADPANGKLLYESTSLACQNCHGSDGTAQLPGTPDIDPLKSTFTHETTGTTTYDLASYINQFMPTQDATLCVGKCAKDIAAYIDTWQPDVPVASCDVNDYHYGRRQMRLLTQREYEETIYDLVGYTVIAKANGVPNDTLVEGFSNQTLTAVTQDYMDAFITISEKAAEFVEAEGFNRVADCTGLSNTECANKFIDEFAAKAYRRPLTEQEKTRYRVFFAPPYSEGKNNEGLKLALNAALSSPYFLYRSEMGEKVADMRDRISTGDKSYEPGAIGFNISAADMGAIGSEYKLFNGGNNNWGNYLESAKAYRYSGVDLLLITAKTTKQGDQFPTIDIKVGDWMGSVALDSEAEKVYTVVVQGDKAPKPDAYGAYVQFLFSGKGSFEIKSVDFAPAVEVNQPAPPVGLVDSAYVLTQYELASFLSYTYTGSMPDEALFIAAKNNELLTETQIKAQITRLLATEKAKNHFGEFSAQWLATDNVLSATKSATLYPEFTTGIRKLMAQEVREIFKDVMFEGNQSVSNIYGNFSFLNQELANFYGVPGVTGTDFTRVDLAGRGGVLTSGAFMAGFAHEEETSPIKRAVAVRERMLCHKVPPMPTDIDAARENVAKLLEEFITAQGSITNRERYWFLTKDAPCSSCHDEIINPQGFGMENFDAIGLLRTHGVNGKAIDASGQLVGVEEMTDGQSVSFVGARALSDELQNLTAARTCFSEKGFRFVMGTGHDIFDHVADGAPELPEDEKAGYQCGVNSMMQYMDSNNHNARAAFTALGISDFVRYRKRR